MIRFLADEDFSRRIVRTLQRREPSADVVLVQETELLGRPDPEVLEWAAERGRVLLTHDVGTMVGHAHERVAAGRAMSGVLIVRQRVRRSRAVLDDLALIAVASNAADWADRVEFLPL